ncbi:RnfABCDGE type electron transport complex subunit D [Coriobacteriia bacterium Es71-Z0120]|uniref:RnfABCDGE type electron transport complex subunit D n=1 Tax=Parvivirga hydrogeniphila TaxID=2939460 RepID=UPI00226100AD|nr:RnfABCDGE type electron transport complex subunit D [Parvivirga hydrogeniphila]MCL4078953.1 RnfABCDGE type electron transport complex subunit D [Parvivirga hydrogeniphila]
MNEAARQHRLVVAAPPHVHGPGSCRSIMLWVVGALAPAALWSVVQMGSPALITYGVCIGTALAVEAAWNALARKPQTVTDGSALVTGLLLAMSLPPLTPWWISAVGAAVAIVLGKMVFGGLGWNLFNPALVGRAFVVLSWGGVLSKLPSKGWFRAIDVAGSGSLDAISGATRLAIAAADRAAKGGYRFDLAAQYQPLLFRNLEGSLGEVSAALLILGGLVLIWRRIIDWRIPVGYAGAMAALSWAFGSDPIFNVLAGGVLLGAFFMATDYVSSPMVPNARLVYGIGCGVFNAVGRFFGSMPEATTFAILFMNGLAPLLDKIFMPRTFGWVKRNG